MKNISFINKIYWVIRQNQWHNGNGQIQDKLDKLFHNKRYVNGGSLKSIDKNCNFIKS